MIQDNLDIEVTDRPRLLPVQPRFKLMVVFGVISFALVIIFEILMIWLVKYFESNNFSEYDLQLFMYNNGAIFFLSVFVMVGLFITSFVFSCMWTYRVGYNIHLAQIPGLSYSPGWYVGWIFIPLANLVMIPLTMIELDKASQGMEFNSKASWRNNKTSLALIVFIVCFVFNIILDIISDANKNQVRFESGSFEIFNDYSDSLSMLIISIIVTITFFVAYYLFAKKITSIHEKIMTQ